MPSLQLPLCPTAATLLIGVKMLMWSLNEPFGGDEKSPAGNRLAECKSARRRLVGWRHTVL